MKWRRTPDPTFLTLLERSAAFTVDAAAALVELFAGEISEESFAPLDDLEHRADANTHDLLLRLEKGHIPPLPSPVTRQIALEIDEIVDGIEGAAEIALLSGIRHPTPIARAMAEVLTRITREVASLVPYIGGGTGHRPYVVRIHDYEGEGDALWEAAYTSLFDGTMEPLDVIRWKDVYAQLEAAIDGCEIAAKTIERAIGRE